MKYRKRPVIIDAVQFVVWNKKDEVFKFEAHGMTFPVYKDDKGHHIIIPTLEGNMRADNLDYIIEGVNGEIYPCKPDIFEKSYEKVEA